MSSRLDVAAGTHARTRVAVHSTPQTREQARKVFGDRPLEEIVEEAIESGAPNRVRGLPPLPPGQRYVRLAAGSGRWVVVLRRRSSATVAGRDVLLVDQLFEVAR